MYVKECGGGPGKRLVADYLLVLVDKAIDAKVVCAHGHVGH